MPAPTLLAIATRMAVANIHHIDDLGDLPVMLATPILKHVDDPVQLGRIQERSPHLAEHTTKLWRAFIRRDCPNFLDYAPPENASDWPDIYGQCLGKETRLKAKQEKRLYLELNRATQQKGQTHHVVDRMMKAPRDVRRTVDRDEYTAASRRKEAAQKHNGLIARLRKQTAATRWQRQLIAPPSQDHAPRTPGHPRFAASRPDLDAPKEARLTSHHRPGQETLMAEHASGVTAGARNHVLGASMAAADKKPAEPRARPTCSMFATSRRPTTGSISSAVSTSSSTKSVRSSSDSLADREARLRAIKEPATTKEAKMAASATNESSSSSSMRGNEADEKARLRAITQFAAAGEPNVTRELEAMREPKATQEQVAMQEQTVFAKAKAVQYVPTEPRVDETSPERKTGEPIIQYKRHRQPTSIFMPQKKRRPNNP